MTIEIVAKFIHPVTAENMEEFKHMSDRQVARRLQVEIEESGAGEGMHIMSIHARR